MRGCARVRECDAEPRGKTGRSEPGASKRRESARVRAESGLATKARIKARARASDVMAARTMSTGKGRGCSHLVADGATQAADQFLHVVQSDPVAFLPARGLPEGLWAMRRPGERPHKRKRHTRSRLQVQVCVYMCAHTCTFDPTKYGREYTRMKTGTRMSTQSRGSIISSDRRCAKPECRRFL